LECGFKKSYNTEKIPLYTKGDGGTEMGLENILLRSFL
jgi:hypothetical protein